MKEVRGEIGYHYNSFHIYLPLHIFNFFLNYSILTVLSYETGNVWKYFVPQEVYRYGNFFKVVKKYFQVFFYEKRNVLNLLTFFEMASVHHKKVTRRFLKNLK